MKKTQKLLQLHGAQVGKVGVFELACFVSVRVLFIL